MEPMMDLREAAQGAGGEARGANARFAAVSSDTRTSIYRQEKHA